MASTTVGLPKSLEELVECLGLIPHPEGGYFKETFRSGSVPMSTRGMTNTKAPSRDIVQREESIRNCLTSIYWVPTKDSPCLLLSTNQSDHVHYYQGGAPFEYILYDMSGTLTRTILGPDILNGHVLQMAVPGGGCFKCGRLLTSESHPPYSIIAEAVGPGFDVQDFTWVTTAELEATGREDVIAAMKEYVHPEVEKVHAATAEHFDTYYDAEKDDC